MSGRLLAWLTLIGVQVAINYTSRATQGEPDRNAVYEWSTVAGGLLLYAVFMLIVLAISREETPKLLALRRPRSWPKAVGIAIGVIVAVVVLEFALDPVLHAGREQGLTPTHWESRHMGAFVGSFILLALVGPFVEEATFRGLGFSLLATYGQVVAVVGTGVLFGLAHGLVEALPILVALGLGLAYLRAKSDSIYPGYIVHGLFNAIALIAAVA